MIFCCVFAWCIMSRSRAHGGERVCVRQACRPALEKVGAREGARVGVYLCDVVFMRDFVPQYFIRKGFS